MRHWIVLLALVPFVSTIRADVTPSGMFGDSMVLQRQMPVPVWGRAEPGEKVTVAFAGQSKTVVTGEDGRWMVKLDPLEASPTGRTLTIRGENTIAFTDGRATVCRR